MIPFERWKINGKYFFIIWHTINSWTIDLSFTNLSPKLSNRGINQVAMVKNA
jgi:hypothetical protein